MNKKLFLILLILPLISFFFGLVNNTTGGSEILLYFVFNLIGLITICIIEVIIFYIFKILLKGKLNDYKLALIIFVITFLLLYFCGGFNDFLFTTASLLKNFSFCYIINDKFSYNLFFFWRTKEKNDCILSVAIKKGDLSACENKVEEVMRESCYHGVARTQKDPTLCEKINNIEKRDWCYAGVAIATKNLDICDKISSQDIKIFCDTAYDNTKQ